MKPLPITDRISEPHLVIPTRKLTLHFQELVYLRAPYFPDTKGKGHVQVLMIEDGVLMAGTFTDANTGQFHTRGLASARTAHPTHWCYLDNTRHPAFVDLDSRGEMES